MANKAQYHRRDLQKEAQAASYLREQLAKLTDDQDAIRDTIEGETDLEKAIAAVVADMREDEIMVSGLKNMIATLSDRKGRLEARITSQKLAMAGAMEMGLRDNITLPEATLSLGKKRRSVMIIDEKAIPAEYQVPQDPKIDKSAVLKALNAGNAVAGAQLSPEGKTLTVRRK